MLSPCEVAAEGLLHLRAGQLRPLLLVVDPLVPAIDLERGRRVLTHACLPVSWLRSYSDMLQEIADLVPVLMTFLFAVGWRCNRRKVATP